MRRSRRGGGSGAEFGSSGEDSFVAVVVTKLTGALLFILLLTMVIMALLPKAVDLETGEKSTRATDRQDEQPLRITTPVRLPEAVAGRSYLVGLAATGGRGPLRWSVETPLPEWLRFDEAAGQLSGTPPRETSSPLALTVAVSDGNQTASQTAQLLVLPFQSPGGTGAWLERRLMLATWRVWLEHGVGFLVLWLVYLLGMNLLSNLERGSVEASMTVQGHSSGQLAVGKRFAAYRLLVRLAMLTAMTALAAWLFLAGGARV